MEKTNSDQIKEKIRQAEESVAGMQDEALKKVAFETVLSSLLSNNHGSTNDTKGSKSNKSPRKKTGINNTSKPRQTQEKISTIQLSVDQLKALKDFYDQKAPDGTEAVVFALAYFLHENLKQSKFHAGDIHLIYQNLLPLKPTKKPPAMSLEDIKRATRWLVAPSRKKQWLKDTGDGMFEVSPQGMLRMTYDDKPKGHGK